MMTVRLARNSTGMIRRFTITGHAGYAPSGEDILCAGVSAIAQTVIGSLQDLAGIQPDYTLEDGRIRCELPDPRLLSTDQAIAARILMESLAVGCRQIEASYGQAFIQVIDTQYRNKGGARA